MLRIDEDLEIPDGELRATFARSSGPGGQNVNKVETKVTLLFDVASSAVLNDEQKQLIRERLATRINRHGVLRVSSSRHRTQAANQRAAEQRFVELVSEALREETPRRETRMPRAARRRRLEEKRRRSRVKNLRSNLPEEG